MCPFFIVTSLSTLSEHVHQVARDRFHHLGHEGHIRQRSRMTLDESVCLCVGLVSKYVVFETSAGVIPGKLCSGTPKRGTGGSSIWPHSFILGKLHLALSAEVLHPSTSNRHINNMAKFLPSELLGRKHLILLADNGPDWALSYANIMSFGKLWKKLKLHRLTVIHYCPHHSRFNFVERRWGRYTLALMHYARVKVELCGQVPYSHGG